MAKADDTAAGPGSWHDQDCRELITAAESAGRVAARSLAQRCSVWELGRTGRVWVQLTPTDSAVASWLRRHARTTTDQAEVRIPIRPEVADLYPARQAVLKAQSLLVARAYAAAYATVLAEGSAVATTIVGVPDLKHRQGRPPCHTPGIATPEQPDSSG